MKSWSSFPLLAAVAAVVLALGGTYALGRTLARREAAVSHEQPVATRTILDPRTVTPELIKRGSTLFLNSCAHCHGADARGDEGPDLHGLEVSDRRISAVIMRGIPGDMPSFAKKHNHDDIVAIIAYLRTLE